MTAAATRPAVGPPERAIADRIDDLVGRTPLLRLPVPDGAPGVTLLAKIESLNPLGSIKDRAALWMMRAAEASGELRPGGTVVEATSGNTGIALAALSAARGYRCVIVLPDSASIERVRLLRAFGAEVLLTPRAERYQGAIDRAAEVHHAVPGSWFVRQHENPHNVAAHYATTGPEIWTDTGGRVDVLVCGIGTGGTLCGAAAHLKERKPGVRAVAVEPTGSPVLSQGWAGTHAIPGLTGGFVAPTTDLALIDEVLTVGDAEAADTARWLARRVGLLAGISSGAALLAALRLARRPESAGATVVTVLPDTGERYLSLTTDTGASGADEEGDG